jgi:hypothetical protein
VVWEPQPCPPRLLFIGVLQVFQLHEGERTVKRCLIAAAAAAALALTGTAGAALVPGVFDPGSTHCVSSTFGNGVLHLAKSCATSTNAAAGADITGRNGTTFSSASFTLGSASQCHGGSPRFDVVTTAGTFFLGCNNVPPVVNGDGSATYTFTAATIAAGGNQVKVPTGTIGAVDVLVDVHGTADMSDIVFDGVKQVPDPTSAKQCKKGGWKAFTDPSFKNQGQCIKLLNHQQHARRRR